MKLKIKKINLFDLGVLLQPVLKLISYSIKCHRGIKISVQFCLRVAIAINETIEVTFFSVTNLFGIF